MLVLTRKIGQSLIIDNCITVKVVGKSTAGVKLGFEAPADIPVFRQEIYLKMKEAGETEISRAKNFFGGGMLVLARKVDEAIMIGDNVKIVVVTISPSSDPHTYSVRLGIEAPKSISIHREELQKRINKE